MAASKFLGWLCGLCFVFAAICATTGSDNYDIFSAGFVLFMVLGGIASIFDKH